MVVQLHFWFCAASLALVVPQLIYKTIIHE